MFAVANLRDREMEDHMESILAFLHENKLGLTICIHAY
jgi:hypothetical protein